MRASGHSKARLELASHGSTTNLIGGFQYQHRPAAACEIRRAHETIVAPAHNDAVIP